MYVLMCIGYTWGVRWPLATLSCEPPFQLKLECLFLLGLWCLLIGYLGNNCVMLLYYTINVAYSVKFKQAVHTERVPPTQNDLEGVA